MNPYEILGVSETASEAEIRKAYLELVRKYHPDQFQDNPLKELANEKLKEVNEAYDILKAKQQGRSASSSRNTTGSANHQKTGISFAAVREALNRNDIQRAESLLRASLEQNAEWHYLMGVVYLRKGQANQALNELEMAVRMDPNNFEYRRAYESIRTNANPYARGTGAWGNTICQICACLSCANICCPCCSGSGRW